MDWLDIPTGLLPAAQPPKDRVINLPSLVLTPKNGEKYFRENYVDGYKCKSVGSYALIKSMIFPYVEWQKLTIRGRRMYAAVAVCGNFGNSFVLWIPEEGAYIYDLELCLIDGTKKENGHLQQGNFFIKPEHVFDLAKDVYITLRFNNEKSDCIERFNGLFEQVIINNMMKVCQPAIFKDAEDSDYELALDYYSGNNDTCHFCEESMIVRDQYGIHYKCCKCRQTYIYNRMHSLVCMFHAVRPDCFEEETQEKEKDGEKYEKTIYKYALDNHTYRLTFGVSKMKIDDCDFGTWTRGLYGNLQDVKERNDTEHKP